MTQKFSILFVDDEPELIDLLSEFFKDRNFEVFTAANGHEALEIIKSNPLQIVLSDVRMPKMGGVKLIEETKKLKHPHPKFILISGFSDIDVKGAKKIGAECLMAKPISFEEIFESVMVSLSPESQSENE